METLDDETLALIMTVFFLLKDEFPQPERIESAYVEATQVVRLHRQSEG